MTGHAHPGLAAALSVALAVGACGHGPPRHLAGFSLGMSQDQVVAAARSMGGFTCRVRGTRPPLTTCDGVTPDGAVQVTVRDRTTVAVTLRHDPSGRNPARQMRRLARRFGDPAWRDRPYPNRFDPIEGYHTLWLNQDSTRSIVMVCAGQGLAPPCTSELALTSPARVHAGLDALLGIH